MKYNHLKNYDNSNNDEVCVSDGLGDNYDYCDSFTFVCLSCDDEIRSIFTDIFSIIYRKNKNIVMNNQIEMKTILNYIGLE